MELLNISPVPVLPSTMWLVFRALTDTPELSREGLIDAVCPPTVLSETPAQGAHVKRAIDALRAFGMIEVSEGETFRVTQNWDLAAFVRALRRHLLGTSGQSEPPAEDILRALEWLVTQSPSGAYERPSSGVFVNDTRWNTFNYWASFLGFARDWPLDEGERSVDPSAAVHDAIFHPFGGTLPGGALEVGFLLRHLESEIPLLRNVVDDGVTVVLPSTAMALRSLAARGELKLERAADAQAVVRFPAGAGARDQDLFSHVTVLGAKS